MITPKLGRSSNSPCRAWTAEVLSFDRSKVIIAIKKGDGSVCEFRIVVVHFKSVQEHYDRKLEQNP